MYFQVKHKNMETGEVKFYTLQVEQVERGLKQAEVDGRRKAEEVQAVKNKVVSFVIFVCLFCCETFFVFFVKQCGD